MLWYHQWQQGKNQARSHGLQLSSSFAQLPSQSACSNTGTSNADTGVGMHCCCCHACGRCHTAPPLQCQQNVALEAKEKLQTAHALYALSVLAPAACLMIAAVP